ncbi:MAG: acetylxylan esterase [Bacteroidales bacterium]|nr:acetylxylan esterase [Bacteroidales bacterium]
MKKIFLLLAGSLFCAAAFAQQPVTFTAQQDHQNMMDQLGIKSIRYAFDADESSPHAANYDESKANPFPVLPEILKTNAGKKVTTAKQWWDVRRPEIVEGFESEVYGRVPSNVPGVTWTVEAEEIETVGRIRAKAKLLKGHVDNSACPSINVDIKMVVVTPADAKGPVPLLMMFGGANLPNPVTPNAADMAVINKTLRKLLELSPETADLMKKYPAWQPFEPANPFAAMSRTTQLAPGQDPPSNQQLLAAGWGYAMIDPSSIQADNGAGLTRGIIGLVNKGQPRKPDDWGSLRAWAWGAARGLDYLETDPDVDAKHVGIEGVSRYGKAALVTLAFEERFYMGLIGSSGKGGATLHRRLFGEGLENLANSGEYHWMAGNYIKYCATESKTGAWTADMLPVDSHELIALCAPRLVFISYGVPEKGDALWLDQYGSWQATVAAGEVFKLLGAKDLGISNDYRKEPMPAVLTGLLDGELAWRQHDGGHTDGPNMKYFIEWATGKMQGK